MFQKMMDIRIIEDVRRGGFRIEKRLWRNVFFHMCTLIAHEEDALVGLFARGRQKISRNITSWFARLWSAYH